MSEGVLLIGHGTRDQAGSAQFLAFADRVGARLPNLRLQPCFLEHAEPGIGEGFDRLVTAGVERAAVVPLFLFAAAHAKVDLPRQIAAAQLRYPDLGLAYGKVLGAQPALAGACLPALAAVGGAGPETFILLVGRGSSDEEANAGLAAMARYLFAATGCGGVEYAFCDVARPGVDEGLRRCLALGARRVVMLPYFLFKGVLMERLRQHLARTAAEHPGVVFAFAGGEGLAVAEQVADLVIHRIREIFA